jgi:quinolinate synthase
MKGMDNTNNNYDELQKSIQNLKNSTDSTILVHNYQSQEIHRVADFLGDSLDLSKKAANTDSTNIVFCGVKFMAETAKILSPTKTVLLPVPDAGCPMANMITPEEVIELKNKYPLAMAVCYVNSTAEVKAVCDVCCTSANAVNIVNRLPARQVIFVPDKNLGSYVQRNTDKEIILWDGFCYVHNRISPADVKKAKDNIPDAFLVVHPECPPEVIDLADAVESTSGMVKLAKSGKYKKFIIGTEEGLIQRLIYENPLKEFYSAGNLRICINMKKTKLEDVYNSLKNRQYEINLNEDIIKKARKALDKMLEYS